VIERFRAVGGDQAAAAMARSFREQTAEELHHRIQTVEVNLHFTPALDALDLRPGLAGVRCPVLVLAGEHDPLLPVEISREIITSLPKGLGELHVIPGAAHDVLVDDPMTTHAMIRAFVQQVTSHHQPDQD
jgi:pimeloyl-ACP methyl ester carboxylesterase